MTSVKLDPSLPSTVNVYGNFVEEIYANATSARIISYRAAVKDGIEDGPVRFSSNVAIYVGNKGEDTETSVDTTTFSKEYANYVAAGVFVSEGDPYASPNQMFGDEKVLVSPFNFTDNPPNDSNGLSHVTTYGDLIQVVSNGDVNIYSGLGDYSKSSNLTFSSINLISNNATANFFEEPDSPNTLEPLLKGRGTLRLLELMLDEQSNTNAESFAKGFRKILRDLLVVSFIIAPPGDFVNVAVNTPFDILGLYNNVAIGFNNVATKYNMSVSSIGPLSVNRTN